MVTSAFTTLILVPLSLCSLLDVLVPSIRQSPEALRGGRLYPRGGNSAAERQLISLRHWPALGPVPPGPANPMCLSQQRQPIRRGGSGGPLLP